MTYGTPSWRDWVLDEDSSRPFIKAALERGITFFDTANVYSLGESEAVLGRAIRDFAPRREDVVLATTVFNPMADGATNRGPTRKHILPSIHPPLKTPNRPHGAEG